MGKPKRFKSKNELEKCWEEYKVQCDSKFVLTHEFSSKNSEFVTKELQRSVTYTIEGFCVFAKIPRQDFYATYAESEKYCDIVTRMREECEIDAREKFELGVIPTQLAGLWMSKYGYTSKSEAEVNLKSEKLCDVLDQVGGEGLEE